ncbi:carbohydrate ABC transporter permease [Mycoplasmopsis columboralis]|uniref:Maltose transport system permease protein malG n=1 Tax=Mycoplasmopsis columboralis TaxID=171282 RepID=A0A449B6I6_9BACT|nr:carbohydrate ABC transporter permease [Mycoplasmopsis columboralis]VEU76220.1 Maltose transport system permease protein malG [Mycoplasmopsis columboralis]
MNKKRLKPTTIAARTTTIVFIVSFAVLWLLPFIIIALTSFKNEAANLTQNIFTFDGDSFGADKNYDKAFESLDFFTSFFITLFLTVASNLIIILLSSLTAWQLARAKTWWSKALFYLFLMSMIIPFQSIMFPLLSFMNTLYLDNLIGMVVMYTGFGLALSIFMMHGFISTIPLSLEEVSKVEGYGPIRIYFKVVLPLLKPIIVTILILNTMWIWNDFLLPYLFLAAKGKELTLITALQKTVSGFSSSYGTQSAALIIIVIPMIVFFIVLQKSIVSGITNGAIK